MKLLLTLLFITTFLSADSQTLKPVYRIIDSLPKCDTIKAWMIFADKRYSWYRNKANMMQIIPVNKVCGKVFYLWNDNVANDTTITIIDILDRK